MAYVGDSDFRSPVGVQMHGPFHGVAVYGTDDRLNVWFYKHPRFNAVRSENEGRPVYDDVDFVHIQQPGETHTIMERPATDSDKRRFPRQWAAYQQQQPVEIDGTPVELLFPAKPGIAESMKALGIFTVEQLAKVSADGMHNIGMGAQEYVNLAQRYLDQAKDGKAFHKMQRELSDAHAQIRVLSSQVQALVEQIGKMNPALAAAAATMPPAPMPGFDTQTSQIAASHPTAELAKRGRKRA